MALGRCLHCTGAALQQVSCASRACPAPARTEWPRRPPPLPAAPCSFMARSDYAFVFHAFALLFYVRTWMWHISPAAATLPGAQGFGWFFR